VQRQKIFRARCGSRKKDQKKGIAYESCACNTFERLYDCCAIGGGAGGGVENKITRCDTPPGACLNAWPGGNRGTNERTEK